MINSYLNSKINHPFFLFVADEQYLSILRDLVTSGFITQNLSDFCANEDKLPSLDSLYNFIGEATEAKIVILGVGEYLALRGYDEAMRVISTLKDIPLNANKVVLLLRGIPQCLDNLRKSDQRFDHNRYAVIGDSNCDVSILQINVLNSKETIPTGFKSLLSELEKGKTGMIITETDIQLDKSLFHITKINNEFEYIKFLIPDFELDQKLGGGEQWSWLLSEINSISSASKNPLISIAEKYAISNDYEKCFHKCISGKDYLNWFYFIHLKLNKNNLTNEYLKLAVENTSDYTTLKSNILNNILEINHTDTRFDRFMKERQTLIENYEESVISEFVVKNRIDPQMSIYRLSDRTMVEKYEILSYVARFGFSDIVGRQYIALSEYLNKYVFRGTDIDELLTDYFVDYKRQKLVNSIEPEFLQQVNELAKKRVYNYLPTRAEILEKIDLVQSFVPNNKENTFLYWLDALGVEYLSFIEATTRKKGLLTNIKIARAELPTITSINRDFYDSWDEKKYKDDRLDEIKHKEKSSYDFTREDKPIYLAEELDIIKAVIEIIARDLALHKYDKFILASDHGASRLAVLHKKEEKYETETKGRHSGRCCPVPSMLRNDTLSVPSFVPNDNVPNDNEQKYFNELPFATIENGWLVLADYGRFKGSRAANVEVHGGASLEEVLVPIIEIKLKDKDIIVKLVKEEVYIDYQKGIEVKLFFNKPVKDISAIYENKKYSAKEDDDIHYTLTIPEIKKAGVYMADIYTNSDLIGQVKVTAHGKSGKINQDFDI